MSLFYTGSLPPLSPPSLPLQHPKSNEFDYFLVWLCVLSGKSETLNRENQTNIEFWCGFRLCECLFCVAFVALVTLFWLVRCALRPPSGQKQTKTSYFKINPYYVRYFVGKIGDQKGQNLRYIWVLRIAGASVVALSLGLCLLSCFAYICHYIAFKGGFKGVLYLR